MQGSISYAEKLNWCTGICRHVYSNFFSAAWILIHHWTRLASSFAGPSPLLCCTIGPLQVDADVSVLLQSKDVLQIQYLLCTPLARSTARTHQQPKIATSGYFTWETGPWQQEKQHQMSQVSILNLKWRHLNAMDFNVKNVDALMNFKVWTTSVPNFSVM
jgi:hypothetical protein